MNVQSRDMGTFGTTHWRKTKQKRIKMPIEKQRMNNNRTTVAMECQDYKALGCLYIISFPMLFFFFDTSVNSKQTGNGLHLSQ